MASPIPQIHFQKPQNPSENSAQTKQAANMEKLKGAVMKLLNNQANTPLSETHKARVEERLTQFLSPLHSPDHPPYAWMIERALQELNERGGSTEESVSKFIRKEYDDLPWAHHTMLKHHLVQLCESGCIVLTQDKRYLLASGNLDLKVKRKSRRKWMKRKRGWDWEKKRSKQSKKVTGKANGVEYLCDQQKDRGTPIEVNEEEKPVDEGIKEQEPRGDVDKLLLSQREDQVISKEVVEQVLMVERVEQQNSNGNDIDLLFCQPKDQGTSNQLHEGRDCMMQGIGQQKLEAQFSKDAEKLCVAEEKGIDCNSDAPPTVTPSFPITDGKESPELITVQQQSSEPMLGITDICSQNAQLEIGGKHLEDNYTELSSPERPPGFEYVILEEVSPVQPWTTVSSELTIHQEQLNQHDEHDILGNVEASGPDSAVVEESIPTERMERQKKRWSKRLAGEKASLISDILPHPNLLDKCPPKSELSHQDKAHGKQMKCYSRRLSGDKASSMPDILPFPELQDDNPPKLQLSDHCSAYGKHHTSLESTLTTEVQQKQCSQLQKAAIDSSKNLQQPDSETLSKLPCLGDYPAEPKCQAEPSKHKRKNQVVQGTEIPRVLRPRPLKPEPQLSNVITEDSFSSQLDQQERQTPESQCPSTKVTNELTMSVDQDEQDLFPAGAKCEPSQGEKQEKLSPKHHCKIKQQIGLRRRGRPPKSRCGAKAKSGTLVPEDVTPDDDQNQQHNEHLTQPPTEKLDLAIDPHLEQQLEKPRYRGRGRPPKRKRGASYVKKSDLQQRKTTKYLGRGRPRKTDLLE
ncbi:uncharacterized protein [Coffea arabica]|uniref:H15 domain-containing protein n=1 Tax=Coffea arabica TaxID=13443 RepID=A0A6P6V6M9_COFAR|nr:uncharacterized protein LOC113717756 [Coffea arabica]